jgi:hypothetical protein
MYSNVGLLLPGSGPLVASVDPRVYLNAVEKRYSQCPVAYPGIFSGGSTNSVEDRTEGRESGDLGTVAPSQGFSSIFK